MYAIIKTGGKQYRVQQGENLLIERLPDAEGDTVFGATDLPGTGPAALRFEAVDFAYSTEDGPGPNVLSGVTLPSGGTGSVTAVTQGTQGAVVNGDAMTVSAPVLQDGRAIGGVAVVSTTANGFNFTEVTKS